MTSATISGGPTGIVWDITYACPLRCTHCYSESGRRPSRQLKHDDLLRVTDALISMKPQMIALGGGEPLVVPGLFELIERFTQADVGVVLFTGGWSLRPSMVEDIVTMCAQVNVSVDGATAEVHDRIRGRAGAFERAMNALRLLNDAIRVHRACGEKPAELGIDATVTRSGFSQLEQFCTTVAPQFSEVDFIALGAAMPIGLASRASFVEHELLSDQQADQLVSAEYVQHLQSLAPRSVRIAAMDNRLLRYHPDLITEGMIPAMQVEPDGWVRAMAIYEGTVGNLLTDSPAVIWERSVARWYDPFVVQTLSPVHTMRQWAEATRRLDYRFGSDDDRTRIDRRPEFLSLTVSP